MNALIEKYKNISRPLKASFWAVVCSALQKCISFITTPIFTRILTTEQYGICAMYDSWFMVIILFTSLSLYSNSFNNAMIKYESRKDEYISVATSLMIAITLVICGFFFIFRNQFSKITGLPQVTMYVMILQLIFVPSYSLWMAKKRFDFEYIGPVITTLLITVTAPLISVAIINITNYKAEAKIIIFGAVQILCGMIMVILNLKKGRKIYDKEMVIYILRFNIPLIPFYLSSIVLAQADRIMIGKMESPSSSAIYSLAYTLSLIMTIVSNAINQSLIPYIYKKIKKNEYSDIKNIVVIACIIVAIINIALILLGPELILFFGTSEYILAKWVIPPVAASVFFIFVYQMFSVILMYYEKTKIMVISSCIVAIINIILNYFGIKFFGYIAAGYTTLISYIILSIIYYVKYNSIVKSKLNGFKIYNSSAIFLISVAVLSFMLVSLLMYKMSPIIRYIILLVIIVIAFYYRKTFLKVLKR